MAKDTNNGKILNESKTDIAYRLMQKKKKSRGFYELWDDVKKEYLKAHPDYEGNLDDDISFFYTDITLDGRFVNVGSNKWDLRERVKFDDVHIDMNDAYDDVDSSESGDDDNDENPEYVDKDEFDDYNDGEDSDDDIDQYRRQRVRNSDDEQEDL